MAFSTTFSSALSSRNSLAIISREGGEQLLEYCGSAWNIYGIGYFALLEPRRDLRALQGGLKNSLKAKLFANVLKGFNVSDEEAFLYVSAAHFKSEMSLLLQFIRLFPGGELCPVHGKRQPAEAVRALSGRGEASFQDGKLA